MTLAKRIAAKRADKERGQVDIEEWGEDDKPLTLFFNYITARDIEFLQRKNKDFLTNPTMSGMVELIIRKCEDKDGEKVFTLEDKPVLMGETIGTIASVFGAIFENITVEEQEKN